MATVAPPQHPSSPHLSRELNFNSERQFGFPTLAPQVPHITGSSFFHAQEQAFFLAMFPSSPIEIGVLHGPSSGTFRLIRRF
jgi:hypothetical protein